MELKGEVIGRVARTGPGRAFGAVLKNVYQFERPKFAL